MVASMHKNESLYLDCPGFAMALQGPGCESFASHGHGVLVTMPGTRRSAGEGHSA